MLYPLRIPRERRVADRAAQFIATQGRWPHMALQIGSRPQPVARSALHLVRGLVAEARQFVGH